MANNMALTYLHQLDPGILLMARIGLDFSGLGGPVGWALKKSSLISMGFKMDLHGFSWDFLDPKM